MTKIDIGELKELIAKQPKIIESVALANRILINSAVELGDFVSIIIYGTESISPEILIRKTELLRLSRESIDRYGQKEQRTWWVTNPQDSSGKRRISGPYTTSADAGVARSILEKNDDRCDYYWIEQF